jgi:tripartite-type tricarboxylate transporter receptor subunit TctC
MAQIYPSRAVRVVVPYPPGQATDVIARLVTQKMGETFGKTFPVENRAGAGGIIGVETVARSAPDGYTLLVTASGPMVINPSLYAKLPYDSLKDFEPISMLGLIPLIIVANNNLPVRSIRELVALAKSHPGEITYASSGPGTAQHLAMELFKAKTGTNLTHIPYKGSGPAVSDLLGGQVVLMFDTVASALPQLQAKKLRPLAVSMAKRSAILPDIPTMSEAGVKGFEAFGWSAMLAPAGTSRDIVQKLSVESLRILNQPDIRERVVTLGFESFPLNPEELSQFMKEEIAKWGQAVKLANIRLEQ